MRREDFPSLLQTIDGKPLIYLDSAATTLKPTVVLEAINHFYRTDYGTVHRAIYSLAARATEQYQNARKSVQSFLNASCFEEILFTRGTTESLNLVAQSFGERFVREGDEILLPEIEHHSNIVPWQWVCQKRGARLCWIRVTDRGELDLDHLASLLSKKTKLLSIAQISNTLGTLHPLEKIIPMAHAVGAKVVVDGAQSAGHLPIDLQALDADFFAFSGHKVYGPTGIGVLFGKRELLEEMPPYQGGGDMIQQVGRDSVSYNTLPYKFEAGTPHSAGAIGLKAAIDYLQTIGLQTIWEHEQSLLKLLQEELQEIPGVEILGTAPQKGGIVTCSFARAHPLDLAALLDLEGIAVRSGHLCSQLTMSRFQKSAVLRISLGLYNEQEEIHTLLQKLKNILSNF